MAIVGGTGEFAYAQGVISFNKIQLAEGNVRELNTPERLETVTIRSGVVVDSLAFSFVDQAGGQHTVSPWGDHEGMTKTREDDIEYNVIASLTIVTNVKPYGPFGIPQSTHFSVPIQEGGSIVGFFACAGKYVEALGVYARPPSVQN
ncbi:hypothetical protein BRADI_4g26112v3 [Brachypodium distachyon]|uniref:Jacalin-type lectin domain-containing protein n=1 Tax=Brachypodium distachyon TaxID=15368 RepID=A0A0Q3HMV7_BRADI|nr:hypothetical protein BRADI_4g26112v3 [Brachypodium distachyon]